MKTYTVSLESAFLNRQFRPIRLSLLGKPVHEALPSANIQHSPNSDLSSPEKENSEQKNIDVTINNHIDTEKISQLIDGSTTVVVSPNPTNKVPKAQSRLKLLKKKSRVRAFIFGGVILACIAILVVLFAPSIYYTVFPSDPIPIETDASGTPLGGNFAAGSARVTNKVAAPAYDENLPDGNWLIIPKIGVKTEILEGETADEALTKGVWRVNDFGTVTDLSKPMILAAHRYGWKSWWENGNQYWRYHSFYLLPDLKQGDLIQVISDHRKYIYEVYAGEQGEEIRDYNADLILYTCKFLDSPLRYFRYARLVDPNNPTALSSK